MAETFSEAALARLRPITRFSPYDSPPVSIRPLNAYTSRTLAAVANLPTDVAARIIARNRRRPVRGQADLLDLGLATREVQRLARVVIFAEDPRIVINDVQPMGGRVMSERPFSLRVEFACAVAQRGVVRVLTEWAGEQFVVEGTFGDAECANGYVDVRFEEDQSLPTGPATFLVTLLTDAGAQAEFRCTCAVLPSNPFTLTVSPRDHFVTGTFSARAVRQGSAFNTAIGIVLSNGGASAVRMRRDYGWEFWDGGVGSGSLVEHGTGAFPNAINVPAFNTWGGWIAFNSPSGSGVFGKLDSREDLSLKITMTRLDGGVVANTITVRTMFLYGVNITRVGAESFTTQEYTDLYNAVDTTRTIYERRDVTLSVDRRNITNAQAGGFVLITSENEARDLFEQWSGPNNDFIDVFVVPAISGTGFDGLAGGIPGPTSHAGRNSGVVVDKSGYTDGSGTRRLNVPYLGMLIGHELGHYLGLVHVTDPGNLMLASSTASDTSLNYDPQYRTIIRHGWVRID